MNKLIITVMLIGMLSGCSGDRYDGLRVVDGDGVQYLLTHRIGDTYFVTDLSTKKLTRNNKANAKLRNSVEAGEQ